jgi:hypothetical protein
MLMLLLALAPPKFAVAQTIPGETEGHRPLDLTGEALAFPLRGRRGWFPGLRSGLPLGFEVFT